MARARTPVRRARARAGYSLMEAIVALFVLAVASTGLLVALQAHVDGVRGLEDRVVAQWVAENRLAELAVGEPEPAAVTLMGVDWVVESRRSATDDPDLQAVEVTVTRSGAASPSSRLSGFVDAGARS
jgi:general secretion pathway protein I